MHSRYRRGFSLLELMVVLVLLGLLLALGTGFLSRYRAQTALNQAVERLMSEIPQAQAAARAFASDHQAILNPSLSQNPASVLAARTIEKTATEPQHVTKLWLVGDYDGRTANLTFSSVGLPMVDYALPDKGYQLQIGEQGPDNSFRPLVSIPFRANGEVILAPAAGPPVAGSITLGNGYSQQRIKISPLGRVTRDTP